MHTVTATTSFEVELTLTGTHLKGYPNTRDDPGMPDSVEDVEIVGFGGLRQIPPGEGLGSALVYGRYETVSLLKGVDVRSKDVQQLLANMLEFLGEQAGDALLEEVGSSGPDPDWAREQAWEDERDGRGRDAGDDC